MKKTAKKTTKKSTTPTITSRETDRFLQLAAKFIESHGWRVIVISADHIQGPVGGRGKYELVIKFIGKKTGEES